MKLLALLLDISEDADDAANELAAAEEAVEALELDESNELAGTEDAEDTLEFEDVSDEEEFGAVEHPIKVNNAKTDAANNNFFIKPPLILYSRFCT